MSAEQMALVFETRGERFRREADEWIDANPDAWEFMVESARASARAGRRFGIGSLVEHVRWHMFAEGVDGFKCNNNFRAPFARRLIKEVPECEPYITTRSSMVDACSGSA